MTADHAAIRAFSTQWINFSEDPRQSLVSYARLTDMEDKLSDPQTSLTAEAFKVEDPLLDNGGKLLTEDEVRELAVHEAEVWMEDDEATPGRQRAEQEEDND